MPIPETLKPKYDALPKAPGVYIFKDASEKELYVGKAKNLTKRVRQYFDEHRIHDQKTMDLVARIADIEFIEVASEVEAFILESRLIKDLQPPFNFYNKSDMSYPVVEVTYEEDFPRVRVTRDRTNKKSRYYGPFVSGAWLRIALQVLQRVFKYRTCSLDIQAEDPKNRYVRPCLEYYIGRCKAPCAGRQSKEDYRTQLHHLGRFLSGQGAAAKKELLRDMKQASKERRYEDAAAIRDTLQALESLSRRGSLEDEMEPGVLHIDPREGIAQIQDILQTPSMPRIIEGIDIAHLQGTETVGALVSFVDGLPSRERYRRYKIKEVKGVDDFASIGEVVRRRYTRLKSEGREMPDLVLIDGGLGQLSAAKIALLEAGLEVPFLASLAKREETLYALNHREGIRLPRRSPALRLLQYVRDEAHRFAQHYHHILRRKRVMDE